MGVLGISMSDRGWAFPFVDGNARCLSGFRRRITSGDALVSQRISRHCSDSGATSSRRVTLRYVASVPMLSTVAGAASTRRWIWRVFAGTATRRTDAGVAITRRLTVWVLPGIVTRRTDGGVSTTRIWIVCVFTAPAAPPPE